MKEEIGNQKYVRILTSALLFLGLTSMVSGQQQPVRTGTPVDKASFPQPLQSDLSKENYDRVAASPSQIRDVLIKDPGILVELKRWIAKEATDTGRIVTDEELTDNAVFDRLSSDVRFRSVATRLVQRYGYLRPMLDPNSEMGKEQELLVKERVRRLVQIEAQEDAEALKPQKNANG